MKVKVWGCRGSLPSPGSEYNEYGGHTSCVQIIHQDTQVVFDGGSGMQKLGSELFSGSSEIFIFLTHLHLDHIMGLGFFGPVYNPNVTIHIYGPASSHDNLRNRLRRYFSPPLFPVRLQELPCKLRIHELTHGTIQVGSLKITAEYVCHPGPTLAYRIESDEGVIAYMPDHEPALGSVGFPGDIRWTSGYSIAKDADLLMHDAQYRQDEYQSRIGWGHSSMEDAIRFAEMTHVKKLLFFHHDPMHSDAKLNEMFRGAMDLLKPEIEVELCRDGGSYSL